MKVQLERFESHDSNGLARDEELGIAYSFVESVPYFERIFALINEVRELDTEGIPKNLIVVLKNNVEKAANLFDIVLNFDAKMDGNPAQARDQLVGEIPTMYEEIYGPIKNVLGYSSNDSEFLSNRTKQADIALKELNDARAAVQTLKGKIETDTEEILKSMREAAGKTGVSKHSTNFASEAGHHETTAKWWMGGTIALGGLALLFAAFNAWISKWVNNFLFPDLSAAPNIEETIQVGLTKFLIFSILIFGMTWAAKNYRAHRHNFVVNKHRQNALTTFETFASATEDEETTNAVLLRTTDAIFGHTSSGYSSGESEKVGGAQIMEIVRNSTKSG